MSCNHIILLLTLRGWHYSGFYSLKAPSPQISVKRAELVVLLSKLQASQGCLVRSCLQTKQPNRKFPRHPTRYAQQGSCRLERPDHLMHAWGWRERSVDKVFGFFFFFFCGYGSDVNRTQVFECGGRGQPWMLFFRTCLSCFLRAGLSLGPRAC